MKNLMFTIAVGLIMAVPFVSGCETAKQKDAAAAAKLQEAQQDLEEARQDAAIASKQLATAEEWKLYKADIVEKIDKNEVRIKDLNVKLKKPGKQMDEAYTKRIIALEQNNKDLRTRLDVYENNQSDWSAFKREFNHDMDELGKALNELTINSTN